MNPKLGDKVNNQQSRNFPHQIEPHQEKDFHKILNNLSKKKETNLIKSDTSSKENYFNIRTFKYDFQALQKYKFQMRNTFSPSKWKVSTNKNSQFSKEKYFKQTSLTGWDMQRVHLSKRSYQQPKQFHGMKADYFSRQFPHDFSKTYSKGFNKKLKQIQLQYENKVFQGKLKNIEQKRNKFIEAIRSRGTRFQLSKDKLFGFVISNKKSPIKDYPRIRNTIHNFYQPISPKKNQ